MSFITLTRGALVALMATIMLPISASAQEVNPLAPDATSEELALEETVVDDVAAAALDDGEHSLTATDVNAWLDGFMPYAIESGDIVGAVVSVVKDGEILTSRGFGYADVETRKPVDGAMTMFRPGSTSKLFTWTAVMQQVELGKIDLDADVNNYLDFKIPDAFGAPITVRHLMTHTAGFEEVIKNLIISDEDQLLSLGDYLKSAIPVRMFPPGQTPAYSNYATALAGYIVERVSGEPFDAYIEKHIFAPLGMQHSTFRQPLPSQFKELMSSGYKNAADGKAGYYELIPPAPAGALASTGEDMGRFMIAHLNQGGPLLKPETARMMHETLDVHTPPLHGMALGFYQQDFNGVRSIGHAGDTVFFHSDLYLFIDKNVGIFISMNSSGAGAGPLRAALGAKFAARYFPEAAGEYEATLDTAKEHGALVSGVYESSRSSKTTFVALTRFLGQFKVAMNEEGDLLLPTGAKPTKWREVAPFVWRKVGGTDRFAAKLNEDGSVEYVTFEIVSPFTQFLTPPWYRSSATLTPLLAAALTALLATFILWPVRAIVRWRLGGAFALSGGEAMSYRLVRVGAFLVFVVLVAWAMVIQTISADLTALTSDAFSAQLRMTQLAQVLFYVAFALAAWNLFVVWKSGQSWFAKLWSAVLLASSAIVIWFAAISGLLHLGANF